MPFTFSHPALVLPIYTSNRKWFSLTGLVMGSISPDFEYFFRLRKGASVYSHTFFSLFWFSLPLSLLLALIFHFVVKRPLVLHLPRFLYQRLADYCGTEWTLFWKRHPGLVVFSILLGAATHLFWDWLTHQCVAWLPISKGINLVPGDWRSRIAVYEVVHFFFSVVGLIVIVLYLRRIPVLRKEKPQQKDGVFWIMILLLTVFITGIRVIASSNLDIKDVGTTIIGGFLLALTLSCVYRSRATK